MTIPSPIQVRPSRQKDYCETLLRSVTRLDKQIAAEPSKNPSGDLRIKQRNALEFALSWITPPELREELNRK